MPKLFAQFRGCPDATAAPRSAPAFWQLDSFRARLSLLFQAASLPDVIHRRYNIGATLGQYFLKGEPNSAFVAMFCHILLSEGKRFLSQGTARGEVVGEPPVLDSNR
jgi:hypothetical protein